MCLDIYVYVYIYIYIYISVHTYVDSVYIRMCIYTSVQNMRQHKGTCPRGPGCCFRVACGMSRWMLVVAARESPKAVRKCRDPPLGHILIAVVLTVWSTLNLRGICRDGSMIHL